MNLFANEDRNFGSSELFVNLILKSRRLTNVRYCVRKEDWDIIIKNFIRRQDIYVNVVLSIVLKKKYQFLHMKDNIMIMIITCKNWLDWLDCANCVI